MLNVLKISALVALASIFLLSSCEDEMMANVSQDQALAEVIDYKEPFKNKLFQESEKGDRIAFSEERLMDQLKKSGKLSAEETIMNLRIEEGVVQETGEEVLQLRGEITGGEKAQSPLKFAMALAYEPTSNSYRVAPCACTCIVLSHNCGGTVSL